MIKLIKNYLQERKLIALQQNLERFKKYSDNENYYQGEKLIVTKKGEPIYLVHILIDSCGFIRVMDINGHCGRLTYIMQTNDEKSIVSIGDIVHKKLNQGIGTEILIYLEQIAKEANIDVITGWLSPVDFGHKDRLIHFYIKNGFDIKKKSNQFYIEKIIT